MSGLDAKQVAAAPRRSLFGRAAGGLAMAVASLVPALAQGATTASDELAWPGALPGRYHQVVDGYDISRGAPLFYARNFLDSNPAGTAASVLILRDAALVIAVNNDIWGKYKIGEFLDVIDPDTKAKAVKNPFLHPKSGTLRNDKGAIDRLVAAGIVVGACNMALHGLSKAAGAKIGVGPDDAAREWLANVVPGITMLPSGVWGLNRAQLAGCTYCAGG